jgi:DNA processing protein
MSTAYWLALTQIAGIGGVTVRKLPDRFGSIEAVFKADTEELVGVPRVSQRAALAIRESDIDRLEMELLNLSDEGVSVLTWGDEDYPVNLRAASDAPPLIFLRGNLQEQDRLAVAIVGTREPSPDGSAIANRLAGELASRGLTIISGLALGFDTSAHEGALSVGGRTLAVLGSGLLVIHPRSKVELAELVARSGALVCEVPPSAPPRGHQLMARDRIISGLSKAVIVVEATERSGSLDTANKARKQKRLVRAVDIGSESTSELLATGAVCIPTHGIDYEVLADRFAAQTVESQDPPSKPEQLGLYLG